MGKLTLLLTSLLIIALVFTGLVTFLSELQKNYDFEVNENLSKLYPSMNLNLEINRSVNVLNASDKIHEDFNKTLGSWDQTGGATNWYSWGDWILRSFGSTIATTASAGGTAREMVTVGGEVAGVPSWATRGIIAIILLAVMLMIVGYLLNRNL